MVMAMCSTKHQQNFTRATAHRVVLRFYGRERVAYGNPEEGQGRTKIHRILPIVTLSTVARAAYTATKPGLIQRYFARSPEK